VTPRVSVVTTVYNGERYFDRAAPSILAQTFDDFEFLIIDDGSTDRTPEMLRDLAAQDRRIRILSPGRLGFATAANLGIRDARGEIIARQDFDDRSYPDRLKLQLALLDAEPKVAIVGGYYLLVDENRNERYVRMPPTDHEGIVTAMAKYIPLAHTVSTFRRQAWVEVGGYPEVPDLEDIRFWYRVVKLGWRIANVPQVIGEHFVHGTSYFHRTFTYAHRQRHLARVQAEVIRELGLPSWMYAFPLGRYAYAYCPTILKRAVRRTLGGSEERDV
jgi:glycosyltransferase EpsE